MGTRSNYDEMLTRNSFGQNWNQGELSSKPRMNPTPSPTRQRWRPPRTTPSSSAQAPQSELNNFVFVGYVNFVCKPRR